MNREELLRGLGTIRDLIVKINQLADKQVRIESQVRQTISTSGAKRKGQMIFASFGIVILTMNFILSIFYGDIGELAFLAISALILWKKRGQKSFLKSLIWCSLVVGIIFDIINLLSSHTGIFILLIPFFILTFTLIVYVIKTKNQKISDNNDKLRRAYAATIEPMQKLQKALVTQCARIRYPEDYLDLNAVEFFIHGIKNYRANTLGQMVNLYEATKDRKRTIALQQQQLRLAEENSYNQAQILGELRFSNALQMSRLSPCAQSSFGFNIGYLATTALFK